MNKLFCKIVLFMSFVSIFASCSKTNEGSDPNSNIAPESYLEFTEVDDGYSIKLKQIPANGKVSIPSTYNGKDVVEIGDHAFLHCSTLTSIEIPNSIKEIGGSAFYHCISLASVVFEEGSKLERIGSCAFSDCRSLSSFDIPSSVTYIGDNAFEYCKSLTSIEIPNQVIEIWSLVFYECESLASITFEEESKLERIGSQAFAYCPLTRILIPRSVEIIGTEAFFECESVIIYCKVNSKPDGWDERWNWGRPVYWGVRDYVRK